MNTLSSLQNLNHPLFTKHKVRVMIKRDDLLHPVISGNKWRKLKYNIEKVKENSYQGIISFGGSYSNHIHALAYACHLQQIRSLAIIRGEPEYADNFTLSQARAWGMELKFVDRKTYRLRHDKEFLNRVQAKYPKYFIVPEGGSNALALPGVGEIVSELDQQCQFDTLMTPVGSGGTLAGLVVADKNRHQLLGVAALKQSDYLQTEVNRLLPSGHQYYNKWKILSDYHCGGYGRFNRQHSEQILSFIKETDVPFEPVYSGKMILALMDLVEKNYFPPGHKIVLLHTGGLQGLGGLAQRKLIRADEWPSPPVPPAR